MKNVKAFIALAKALPDVATVGETLKGFETSGWYALPGPANMPRAAAEVDVQFLAPVAVVLVVDAPDVHVIAREPGAILRRAS